MAVPSLLADLVAALGDACDSLARGDVDGCSARCTALLAALPAGESWVRGWTEWVLGLACWLGGATTEADRWLRDGLGYLAPFGDDLSAAHYLEAFAWLAAARGEHQRTAWLHGAADRRWQRRAAAGAVRAPRLGGALLRAERDRAERAARDALGADGYAAEHEAGVALTETDALRRALAGRPRGRPRITRSREPRSLEYRGRNAHRDRKLSRGRTRPTAGRLLTAREREVATLVATGLTNKDIATRLFLSKRTVDAHLEHILAKLSYTSRVQIVALIAYAQALEEEQEADASLNTGPAHRGSPAPVKKGMAGRCYRAATKQIGTSLYEHDSLGMV